MAYCRFENTASDLKDCADALDDEGTAELSDSEQKAFKRLLKLCKRIFDDYGDDS